MKFLKVLAVRGRFHWGFWVRTPLTSSRQGTYVLPPPSTLIGALAYAYFAYLRARGVIIGEFLRDGYAEYLHKFALGIDAVYFRPLDPFVAQIDITRQFQAPYIRRENLGDPQQWFNVRPVGKVYAPNSRFEVAYVVNEDFSKFHNQFCDEDYLFVLRRVAMSIVKLGPVEGLVTVEEVKAEDCKMGDLEMWDVPCPYFEVFDKWTPPMGWEVAEFFDWKDEEFWRSRTSVRTRKYAVPAGFREGVVVPLRCRTLRTKSIRALKCSWGEYPWLVSS